MPNFEDYEIVVVENNTDCFNRASRYGAAFSASVFLVLIIAFILI